MNELEWLPQNDSDNVLNDENNVEHEGYHESEKETESKFEDEEKNQEIQDQENETIRIRSGRQVKLTKDRKDNQYFLFNRLEYVSNWTPMERKFHKEMR